MSELCAFCDTESVNDQHARLLAYHQLGQHILAQLEKTGRSKVKATFPELVQAIDQLGIAGDHYAQTFLERFKMANAVCQTALQNGQIGPILSEYAQHCKHHNHSSF